MPTVPKDCCGCSKQLNPVTLYQCDHAVLCSKCFLLLWRKDDRRCVVCRRESENVIITNRKIFKFTDYTDYFQQRKLKIPPLVYDERLHAFFTDEKYQEALNDALDRIRCRRCVSKRGTTATDLPNIAALRKHLISSHFADFCDLCLEHREVLLCDQETYLKNELRDHLLDDHPFCEFCTKHFYSEDMYRTHLYKTHAKCHVCEAVARHSEDAELTRKYFEFYKDEATCARHHQTWHYVCNRGCSYLMASFPTAGLLANHMREAHNEASFADLGERCSSHPDLGFPPKKDHTQLIWSEDNKALAVRYFIVAPPAAPRVVEDFAEEPAAPPSAAEAEDDWQAVPAKQRHKKSGTQDEWQAVRAKPGAKKTSR